MPSPAHGPQSHRRFRPVRASCRLYTFPHPRAVHLILRTYHDAFTPTGHPFLSMTAPWVRVTGSLSVWPTIPQVIHSLSCATESRSFYCFSELLERPGVTIVQHRYIQVDRLIMLRTLRKVQRWCCQSLHGIQMYRASSVTTCIPNW